MTDRPVTKTRQRRPEARPAEILGAALALFAEKGFTATRMEDVAAKAGLSKAAIYLYFDDKMALLRALVRETMGANLAVAGSLVDGHEGPVGPLLRQIITFMAGQIRHTRLPELVKIVISESRAHPEIGRLYLDNVIRNGLPLFERLIAHGIAAGEFRTVDPRFAAKSLIAPMLLGAIWKTVFEPIGAEDLDVEALAQQHVDVVLRGIAA